MSQATPDTPANTLSSYYADYFGTEAELEWYRVCAIDKARNVATTCADVPHETVLDVGTGDGAVLHRLEQTGFGSEFFAVEISQSGIEAFARKPWKKTPECRLFDGYNIPYEDDRFDLAVVSHVVEHVEHPRWLLREAARVARHVYVEVPLELTLHNKAIRRDFVLDNTGHINFYNPDLIRLLVQSTGLRVLRQKVMHFGPAVAGHNRGMRGKVNYWIKHSALKLAPRMATRIFTYQCGLLCAKATRGTG